MNTNELKQAFIKRMIQKIETEINLTLDSLNSESDKREFKRNNEFNKAQLEKYLNEYLTDRHVELMKKGESVFNNVAINAFNSYIAKRNKELTKLPKNNPYSDLDGSNSSDNGYKETNRWERQITLRLMKSLVPLRYTETFIGSTWFIKVRKMILYVFS